jgi:hypothetical protein
VQFVAVGAPSNGGPIHPQFLPVRVDTGYVALDSEPEVEGRLQRGRSGDGLVVEEMGSG